jgi:hypothetical protein
MAKTFALVLMIAAMWIGMEIYTEGSEHAFGGAFSFLAIGNDMPEKASHHVSTPQRVGAKVDGIMRENEARYQEMLGE